MIELNRILIQTNEAVEYANSGLTNKKRLAIILLDNLIEIQVLKKVENTFLGDETNWYSGMRSFSQKERKAATHYLEGMLKFSKKHKFISEQEFSLLTFAHNIRNEVYHKGESDDYLLDIAIIIYISFIDDKIRDWQGSTGIVILADKVDYKQINFGQGIDEVSILRRGEKYFEEALSFILSKYQPVSKSIQQLISENIENQINEIKESLKYLDKRKKDYNLYEIFTRYWYITGFFEDKIAKNIRPKNIDSILSIINFLKLNKEEFDDIDDIKHRRKKYNKMYSNYKKGQNGKYKYKVDLNKYLKIAKDIKKEDRTKALQRGLQIQNNLLHLYEDVREAHSELCNYEQDLLDMYREK